MRKRKFSRFIAATTAATLLLTPMTALAAGEDGDADGSQTTTATEKTDPADASGEIGGNGQFEGYVDKKAFRIVLPTISNVNFTIDPQGLLHVADEDTYGTASGAVYFENAPTTEGGSATYSNKSDAIEFANKSSYKVKVGLSITLNTGDIALAKSADLATATVPSLNLGLIKGTDSALDIDKASYQAAAATVEAVPEVSDTVTSGYKISSSDTAIEGVTASPNGKYYSFALTDDYEPGDDQKVAYQLTGSCNDVEGWKTIENKSVTAKIAWTVTDATAPGVTGTAYSRSSNANTYTLENVSQEISSIDVSVNGTTIAGSVPAGAYSLNEDKDTLTIDGTKNSLIGAGGVGAARYFIINFADGSKLKFSVTVSA